MIRVSLNIKNERTHALVRELAEVTGMSQTSAVEDAVRRRLDEIRGGGGARDEADVARRRAALERIVAEVRAETTPQQRAAMQNHGDWLYDEMGLPT